MEHVGYPSKKLLIKQKTSSRWWVLLWKDFGFFSDRIVDSQFFVTLHRSGCAIFFSFWTIMVHVSYPSKNLLIKKITSSRWWVLLEGLWMVSNRISGFQFFVKFHRSGPVIIFSFWTITEHDSIPSKMFLIEQKTSSKRWVVLWKDYRWFLIALILMRSSWISAWLGAFLMRNSLIASSIFHQTSLVWTGEIWWKI